MYESLATFEAWMENGDKREREVKTEREISNDT